jgi:Protein of unknown function (DUF3047)
MLFLACAAQATEVPIPKFSTAEPGAQLPAGWEKVELPYGNKNEFQIVADGKSRVLQIHSEASFGSVAHRMSVAAADSPVVHWRWKIDHVLEKARMDSKAGEDFAARFYVSFDFPVEELPPGERVKLSVAGAVVGFVPAAAICYVWDNHHTVGVSAWSPYFGHVRVIVLESGNGRAGQWVEEKRDVEADFVAAFGEKWKDKVPRITGVVAGSDTDQTGESVTAWFGDIRLGPRS